jgi:hypothetical protein
MQSKSIRGHTMLQGIEKSVKTDIATAKSAYEGLGVVASFFSFMQGRSTAFGVVFTICGLIGFFKHMDLTSYSLFVGAIFTGVIGHSLKEDYFEMRKKQGGQHEPPVEKL